jgi:hypothetical protein
MSGHVSFAPITFSAVAISFATVAVSPVQADNACIEQRPRPVAEETHGSSYASCRSCHAVTAEEFHWVVRNDRAKGRKCWFLLDANGRDVTAHVHARAQSAPTLSSTFASLFGNFNFMGAPANVTQASNVSQISSPSPRKQGDTAEANKIDHGVQVAQKDSGDGQVTKRVSQTSIHPEDRALFEEFLQWRERQNIFSTSGPTPSTRQ